MTMLGWFNADAARASCSKRRSRSASFAPEPRVPRAIHLPHPARAELAEHLVGTELRAGSESHRRFIPGCFSRVILSEAKDPGLEADVARELGDPSSLRSSG